jgi:hypothetical protein
LAREGHPSKNSTLDHTDFGASTLAPRCRMWARGLGLKAEAAASEATLIGEGSAYDPQTNARQRMR